MRTFLKWLGLYLLIGCFVTAYVMSNWRGGRDDAGAAAFVVFAGPFIWPALIPQQIEQAIDAKNRLEQQARKREEAFASEMRGCPEGFEEVCRAYFSHNASPQAYTQLIQALRVHHVPLDTQKKGLVLGMAERYGTGQPVEQVERDTASFAREAPENARREMQLARAALLQSALSSSSKWLHELRKPYQDREKAAMHARILHTLLETYSQFAPMPLEPSLGMATLYEGYANALEVPGDKTAWRDKALAEYSRFAATDTSKQGVLSAIAGFCTLADDEKACLDLLRGIADRRLVKDKPAPDWVPQLWVLNRIYYTDAPRSYLAEMLPFFTTVEYRIEATGFFLELISLKTAFSAKYTYPQTKIFREAVYTLAAKQLPPDRRWADMLLRLLQRYDPGYEKYRFFYEAERAWFFGDTATAESLLRQYKSRTPRSYEETELPLYHVPAVFNGREFIDLFNALTH